MANSSFVKFFTELEATLLARPSTVHAIFQRNEGEYYTAHGKTAVFLADHYFKTREVLTYYEEQQLPGLSIRPTRLVKILHDILLNKKQKVELYTKNEDDDWVLSKKASPGNILLGISRTWSRLFTSLVALQATFRSLMNCWAYTMQVSSFTRSCGSSSCPWLF